MGSIDELVNDILESSANPKSERKNVTLRLPLTTHKKLANIMDLTGSSKTVAAEDILITAVDDVYQRLMNDPRLEDHWIAKSIEDRERQEHEEHEAAFGHYESLNGVGREVRA